MPSWKDFQLGSAVKGSREDPTVIHLNTGVPQSGGVSASLAEALKLVNLGVTPRIFFTIPRYYPPDPNKYIRRVDWRTISSMLRVTLELTSVRFSEASVKPNRVLLRASYYNETTKSAELPPLLNGSTKLSVFPMSSGPDDTPPLRLG